MKDTAGRIVVVVVDLGVKDNVAPEVASVVTCTAAAVEGTGPASAVGTSVSEVDTSGFV